MISANVRARWSAAAALWVAAFALALGTWVETAPVPHLTPDVSTTVLDREGRLLRAYQVGDGRWRLPVDVGDVDPDFVAQLIAYEDRRFFQHAGVDPAAILRAIGQAAVHGRAVSGASTLTMQVARLLRAEPSRTMTAKIAQMRLALALERRLTKRKILTLYLTLAPYGGNIEGIRAASLTWFGKEPTRLTPAQAALLVALPQSPAARRPDRFPKSAEIARNQVLRRAVRFGALPADDAMAAMSEPLPTRRRPFAQLAPHLADQAVRDGPSGAEHILSIDGRLQASLEKLVQDRIGGQPARTSVAMMVADHRTGEILAAIGSPGLDHPDRGGFLDMSQAVRSPGSTLKPMIYALAFEDGLAHPESLIDDRPIAFGSYVPTNFDGGYQGTISVRRALQLSLNVPAVALLDGVGPARLSASLRRAGINPRLPRGERPGLAMALGGLGLTLQDLVELYAGIARGGTAIRLRTSPGVSPDGPKLLSERAAWQVGNVLAYALPPSGAEPGRIAFKTGTSYGHRDAWAIGYDGAHVVGVWVGRPDAAPVPGITGQTTAAPLVFEAFSRISPAPVRLPPPPNSVLQLSHADLPPPLRQVRLRNARPADVLPKIAFPPDGARVEAARGFVALKVRDGTPPFTWLVDGQPVSQSNLDREALWRVGGGGYATISVIDGRGAGARAHIFIE